MKTSRLDQPAGIILSFLIFLFEAFASTVTTIIGWNFLRELYCSVYQKSAFLLCQIIESEFRPDLILLTVATLFIYSFVYFYKLRKRTLRTHIAISATLLGIVFAVILIRRLTLSQ